MIPTHTQIFVRFDRELIDVAQRSGQQFSEGLYALLQEHTPAGSKMTTLHLGKPNWIVGLDSTGMLVETERSRRMGHDPQRVPAWMFEVGWARLQARGRLTNRELLDTKDLNVKRSSLVCAVLARLPGVRVESERPIVLVHERASPRAPR